jgi:hypothetical protein
MMKQMVFGLVALGALAFASGPVNAQTFQNGPYYANPAWDQQIPAAQRFIVLSNWNNEAVLDRETGLVWERTPDTGIRVWSAAIGHCNFHAAIGNRLGWRLPSLQELGTLVDKSQSSPALPAGHPFQGILGGGPGGSDFWSATTLVSESNPGFAIAIDFLNGEVSAASKTNTNVASRSWCVRGNGGHSAVGE